MTQTEHSIATSQPEAPEALRMRSHVGRDILQSAQMFRTVEAAVWEYVVNSLQYVDNGVTPRVDIRFNKAAGTITIDDNASGMSQDLLAHFFTMHGENRERAAGRIGRGKFGTGKSAAYGVGTSLEVDTTHAGLRNVCLVTLDDIEAAGDGDVPVRHLVVNEPVPGKGNGTRITIAGVTRTMNVDQTTRRLSRYLTSFRHATPVVKVNGEQIDVFEPEVRATRTFTPEGDLAAVLGGAMVTVKVAAEPLEAEDRGVSVTVGPGNLVARTDAGVGAKEFGSYLFGEVDCPALESNTTEQVSPYGANRDLSLNVEHPVAGRLFGFIGYCLEQVRGDLVEENKQARRDQQSRRLQKAADEIAAVLNDDFNDHAERLEAATANTRRRSHVPAAAGPEEENPDNPTYVVDVYGEPGEETGTVADNVTEPDPNPDPEPRPDANPDPKPDDGGEHASPAGVPNPEGEARVRATPGAGGRRPRGGISVVYEKKGSGEETHRAYFDADAARITINIEHPALAAALAAEGDNVDGKAFRRASYEAAFTEYAMALARLEYQRNPEIDGGDVLFEVRDALRRVTARATALYQ